MNIALIIIAALALVCICLVFLYIRKVKAMNIIIRGVDLIKEQDFGSRLLPVGQSDADKIISLFNRMICQLTENIVMIFVIFFVGFSSLLLVFILEGF